MIIKYNIDINEEIIKNNLLRIIKQIYKLLPMREEGVDWVKPLETIMVELAGVKRLMVGISEENFLTLFSKLEGLFTLTRQEDFMLYRRMIFECLGLLNLIINDITKS